MNIINKIKNKFLYLIISKQLKFKQKVLSEGLNLKNYRIDATYDNFLDSKKFLVAVSLSLSLIIIIKDSAAQRFIEQNGSVELSTKNHVCNVQNLPSDEVSSITGNKRVNLLKNILDVSYITNNKFILDGGNPFLNANSEQK